MKQVARSIQWPLNVLRKIGFFYIGEHHKINPIVPLYILLLAFSLGVQVLQLVYLQGDILAFVSLLEAISGFGQYFGKAVFALLHQQSLRTLIFSTNCYWKTNTCSQPKEKALNNILAANLFVQKAFLIALILCIIYSMISPFLDKSLPLGVWTMDGYPAWRKAVIIIQIITLALTGFFLFGYDTIYLGSCSEIVVQFRIMCEHLQRMDTTFICSKEEYNRYFEDVKKFIKYHIFLLSQVKLLQRVYSSVMLVQYVSSAPVICAEMYLLFESKTKSLLIPHVLMCLTISLQLAFYCIPVDYIASEAQQLGNAIYSSKWYLKYVPGMHKLMAILLHQSQQRIVFTAGGLFHANSTTLITVLKLSWSACTVMKALKRKL